jgi:hypothetical protein
MDTQLLSRLPLEQARCRELARQFGAMGSIGCFAAALIEEALRRADRAIIDGCEESVRRALQELQAFGSATQAPHGLTADPALRPLAPLAAAVRPRLAIAVPPVGRRPPRFPLAHVA